MLYSEYSYDSKSSVLEVTQIYIDFMLQTDMALADMTQMESFVSWSPKFGLAKMSKLLNECTYYIIKEFWGTSEIWSSGCYSIKQEETSL